MRAMALTYISLFALVPALVVAFSVVQAFTGLERISDAVHELLLENLAVGARESIEPYLDRFVQNAHLARAGLVGAALLLWSAYSLFSHVEGAVNELWEVQRRRSIRMQALTYWMGLTLGPLLLAASATIGQLAHAYFQSRGARALTFAASWLISSSFLTLIYLVVPNARVRLRSAVVGGVAAGVAWELAKWLFALFVGRFVRYSAIYGSVAAIPIFLTWLYLSWCIILFGARLAFVVQNAPVVMAGGGAPTGAGRELFAGRALALAARAFQTGKPAPRREQLVRSLRAGPEALEVLEALGKAGLLRALAAGGLVPARAPETITLLEVRRAVGGSGSAGDRKPDALGSVLRQADALAEERLRLTTIADLCRQALGDDIPTEPPEYPPSGSESGTPKRSGS
jgi:membrane protein